MTIAEDNFRVRPMTKDDLKIALSWAASEGWNPGVDDVNNFYVADPGGFLIGELNGDPISCISAVRHSDEFNFIGIYIVTPEERNKGFGLKTWYEALKLIADRPAALDAVLQQVGNYQRFGFKPAHSHLRYQGIVNGEISSEVRDLKTIDFEQLCRYDRQYFPSDRHLFLATWINQPHGQGYAIVHERNLVGYGAIRKAIDGFKIAPLFALRKVQISLKSYS